MENAPKDCHIIEGNALDVLRSMKNDSVDCVVCSPPYWSLRDYGSAVDSIWDAHPGCNHQWLSDRPNGNLKHRAAKTTTVTVQKKPDAWQNDRRCSHSCRICGAWKGQLGLEPSFELYLKHLCEIFDEVNRVLKTSGTCWIVLGDTYAGSWGAASHRLLGKARRTGSNQRPPSSLNQTVSAKSLCSIPFRFAIEMTNRGWILRNVVIWQKPNALPCSAKDRFSVDFEYLFFFTKSPHYFFRQQFEPHHESTIRRVQRYRTNNERYNPARHKTQVGPGQNPFKVLQNIAKDGLNPLGRNMRCVWNIPTRGFDGAHFAAYPEKLCEIPIKTGCPEFVCAKCGTPQKDEFTRYIERKRSGNGSGRKTKKNLIRSDRIELDSGRLRSGAMLSGGYPDCDCNAGMVPGVVLDPFFGAGTTGIVAAKLGRACVGTEANPGYVKLAKQRLGLLP